MVQLNYITHMYEMFLKTEQNQHGASIKISTESDGTEWTSCSHIYGQFFLNQAPNT